MDTPVCEHEEGINEVGVCKLCGDTPGLTETCPECDEACSKEALAQWGVCHDCENQLCEECGFWDGHEDGCTIGIAEFMDNPE